MKIVIQHRKTHLFFKDVHQWTTKVDQAKCFDRAITALQFSGQNLLGDTQVVFKHVEPPVEKLLLGAACLG